MVFEVERDDDTFKAGMSIIEGIYNCQKRRRPKRLPEQNQQMIENGRQRCKFIGEFPSVLATNNPQIPEHITQSIFKSDILDLLEKVRNAISDGYHLCREKANDILPFNLLKSWNITTRFSVKQNTPPLRTTQILELPRYLNISFKDVAQ
jgi:hypothetical protein